MPAQLTNDLFRCAPLSGVRISASRDLVYSYWTKESAILPSHIAVALLSCNRFQTIAQHANRILSTSETRPDFENTLETYLRAGFLVGLNELRQKAENLGSDSVNGESISWLAIPTCDRPSELTSAVQSYAENARRFGSTLRLLVSDDSRTSFRTGEMNRLIGSLGDGCGAEMFYISRANRERYASHLADGGDVPLEVARFGLLGPAEATETHGANRNAILLQTQGSKVLSVDDDTVCEPGVAPGSTNELKVFPHSDEESLWFFRKREDAVAFTAPRSLDVTGEHLRLLGSSLLAAFSGAAKYTADPFASLDELCAHMWMSVCTDKDSVLVTLNGMAGDSGMSDTKGRVTLASERLTRLRLESTEAYRAALGSRELVRQSLTQTIAHTGPFMTTCIGMDNRKLLPPFFPAYRNEDAVFGLLLSQCFPHGYLYHLPFILKHLPNERRFDNPPNLRDVELALIVGMCIRAWPGAPRDSPADTRIRSIGEYLIELASFSLDDFFEFLRLQMYTHTSERIALIESLLARYTPGQDDPWGQDLVKMIRKLEHELLEPGRKLPVDLLRYYPEDVVADVTKELVGQYGQLLYWWPTMVSKASVLAAKEIALAERIRCPPRVWTSWGKR